jgi:hypothetical protein
MSAPGGHQADMGADIQGGHRLTWMSPRADNRPGPANIDAADGRT